jgi:uncharacterized protein YndB with AHSA1/START domain
MTAATAEATQTIVVEYDLPHAPGKVWRALTEPALVARWLMENDIRPVVGHRFTFRAPPTPGWNGVVECEVLEVATEQRLVYSWRGGSDDLEKYGSRLDTVVSWTLTAKAGGTLLRLEHTGFQAKDAFALDGLGKGWRGKVGERFAAIVAEIG